MDFVLLDSLAMTQAAAILPPERGFESLAQLCKAAGDPLRLEILRSLRRDSYGVLELCRIFGVRQPAMSHHLKVLADAGLVCRRREGTSIFYHRAHRASCEELDAFAQSIYVCADRICLGESTLRGVARVQSERAASSREFFATNSRKFRAQQELIAPREQYQQAIDELLAEALPVPAGLAVELGPGEGWLLTTLAARCRRVVAIDNSPAMLEQARSHCAQQQLGNVELMLGDNSDARTLAHGADLAVVNMVLHHTASPADVLIDMAATLRPGGVLLLTDLCTHDQSWARDACGDLWLGFSPEDLSRWARDAGLDESESVYLALRNGFRVQLRLFQLPS